MGLDVFMKRWERPKGWEVDDADSTDFCNNFTYLEFPSSTYPDHLFKVGYFRSSYNDSGLNRKLRNTIGIDLYSIFNPPPLDDAYHFQPDWELAKSISQKALRDLKDYIAKGGYGVLAIDHHLLYEQNKNSMTSEAIALQKFLEIADKHSDSKFGNFISGDGHFFLNEPLKVVGVIPGLSDLFRHPCNYVIYKDESWDWYLQAIEIVVETCEWVLAQEDIDHYCLAWSG